MNTFTDYYKSLTAEEKDNLAVLSGIKKTYLSNVANGHRNAGRKTILSLMSADEAISFEMFIDAPPKRRKGHVNS